MSGAGDPLDALDPDQRSEVAERPLPRRRLGPGLIWLLAGLRLYVVAAVALAIYAFVVALRGGG